MEKLFISELTKVDVKTISDALDEEFINYEWKGNNLLVEDTDTEAAVEIIQNLGYSVEVL